MLVWCKNIAENTPECGLRQPILNEIARYKKIITAEIQALTRQARQLKTGTASGAFSVVGMMLAIMPTYAVTPNTAPERHPHSTRWQRLETRACALQLQLDAVPRVTKQASIQQLSGIVDVLKKLTDSLGIKVAKMDEPNHPRQPHQSISVSCKLAR